MIPASSRNSLNVPRHRCAAMMMCAVVCLSLSGCGGPRNKPVKVELAKATLNQVLEHWKSGGNMDDLRKRSPEIVVQEAQWTNGAKLQEFQLIGDGRAEDANWYCEVQLTLMKAGGSEPIKKTVTYVVGTDPVLTVFHAIL